MRRPILFLFFVLAAVQTITFRCFAESWLTVPSGVTQPLGCVNLLTAKHLYAAGGNGNLLMSTDEGASWSKQRFANSYGGFISSMVVDTLTQIACGENGQVLYFRNDGHGLVWKSLQPLQTNLNAITSTGWYWDTMIVGSGITPTAIHTQDYIVVGDDGSIWKIQAQRTTQWGAGITDTFALTPTFIYSNIKSALRGVVVVQARILCVGDSGIFLRSDNKGGTWTSVQVTKGATLRSIAVLSENKLMAVGDGGNIWLSKDGGVKWTSTTPSGLTQNLSSVSFVDSLTGVVVGDGGLILKTTDGGQSWSRQATNTFSRLNSVFCYNGDDGSDWVAVGDSGTIVQSEFAGATAMLSIVPDTLDLGDVGLSSKNSQKFTISNPSVTGYLTILASSNNPKFTVTPARAIIVPQDSQVFKIVWKPGALGEERGNIMIESDTRWLKDTVYVRGRAVAAIARILVDTIIDDFSDTLNVDIAENVGNIPLTTILTTVSDTNSVHVECSSITDSGSTVHLKIEIRKRPSRDSIFSFIVQSNDYIKQLDTFFVLVRGVASVFGMANFVPAKGIRCYPNPVDKSLSQNVFIETGNAGGGSIKIFTSEGREVTTVQCIGPVAIIPTNILKCGSFFLQCNKNQGLARIIVR